VGLPDGEKTMMLCLDTIPEGQTRCDRYYPR